jgi:hypothetical protein
MLDRDSIIPETILNTEPVWGMPHTGPVRPAAERREFLRAEHSNRPRVIEVLENHQILQTLHTPTRDLRRCPYCGYIGSILDVEQGMPQ